MDLKDNKLDKENEFCLMDLESIEAEELLSMVGNNYGYQSFSYAIEKEITNQIYKNLYNELNEVSDKDLISTEGKMYIVQTETTLSWDNYPPKAFATKKEAFEYVAKEYRSEIDRINVLYLYKELESLPYIIDTCSQVHYCENEFIYWEIHELDRL